MKYGTRALKHYGWLDHYEAKDACDADGAILPTFDTASYVQGEHLWSYKTFQVLTLF